MALLAMIAGLTLAGLFTAYGAIVLIALAEMEDRYDSARETQTESWDAGRTPLIEVDSFGGAITVEPGPVGRVEARIDRHGVCKNRSDAYAEAALKGIEIVVVRDGDSVRIVTRVPNGGTSGFYLTTSIELRVPDGSRLDLKTGVGSIWVTGSPSEIKVRNPTGAIRFDLNLPAENEVPARTHTPETLVGSGKGEIVIRFEDGRYVRSGPVRPFDIVLDQPKTFKTEVRRLDSTSSFPNLPMVPLPHGSR